MKTMAEAKQENENVKEMEELKEDIKNYRVKQKKVSRQKLRREEKQMEMKMTKTKEEKEHARNGKLKVNTSPHTKKELSEKVKLRLIGIEVRRKVRVLNQLTRAD